MLAMPITRAEFPANSTTVSKISSTRRSSAASGRGIPSVVVREIKNHSIVAAEQCQPLAAVVESAGVDARHEVAVAIARSEGLDVADDRHALTEAKRLHKAVRKCELNPARKAHIGEINRLSADIRQLDKLELVVLERLADSQRPRLDRRRLHQHFVRVTFTNERRTNQELVSGCVAFGMRLFPNALARERLFSECSSEFLHDLKWWIGERGRKS